MGHLRYDYNKQLVTYTVITLSSFQRDKEKKDKREKETKRKRDKETKRQRDKETKRQRDK